LETLIEARDLRKTFDGVNAVDGLSISVKAGEVFALVGPDGAGKTTTMRLICGALQIDEGSVTLAGYDIHRQTEQARAQIGYLAQRFSLYHELTVIENLRFFAEMRGLPVKEWLPRSQEILEFVGLEEFSNRRAGVLSGGMKQKLGLAVALVHQPPILLLDEPTSGVDAVTRQAFWQLIIKLLKHSVAVLISTPYMDEASRCSRVGFMSRGRLLIEGSPSEIVRHSKWDVVELIGGPRRLVERLSRSDPQVEGVQTFGDRLHLRVAPGISKGVITRIKTSVSSEGGVIKRIRPISPGLEDVFIELLEGGG
jgi:ABC-2 type transport system ATP-binding protein